MYWSEVANGGGETTPEEKGKVSGLTYPILLFYNKDDNSIKKQMHI